MCYSSQKHQQRPPDKPKKQQDVVSGRARSEGRPGKQNDLGAEASESQLGQAGWTAVQEEQARVEGRLKGF